MKTASWSGLSSRLSDRSPSWNIWTARTAFDPRGRTREEALAMAERLAYDQDRWVWISEDLRDAFEHIPTGRLMQILRHMVPSEPICRFVTRIATKAHGRGIRQGGPLSPELLNVYLHWMLDRWWCDSFPEVPLIRVADDLLILTRDGEEAQRLYNELGLQTQAAGMPLKGTPWTSIRDLPREQTVRWLGYDIRRQERGLQVSIASRSWAKLEEHLQMAWDEPIPPLTARESIHGWIQQQGAAYRTSALGEVYSRITQIARDQRFPEIPARHRVESLWRDAHLRQWVRARRETLIRVRRHIRLADGSAHQHCDFRTSFCRGGVARTTAASPQQAATRREVSLYCDGSRLRQGVGGWAYLLVDAATGERQQEADSHPRTTHNRMELYAVVLGLEALTESARVHVVTDSQYVFRGITDWLSDWSSSGWRSSGRPSRRIKNLRRWQRLAAELERHEVDCRWVRGHSGHAKNELVDTLAREAAQRHFEEGSR